MNISLMGIRYILLKHDQNPPSYPHKWTYYSHTLQQMTILVVVCSYLYIVTFLAVCKFLNFNVMNFERKVLNSS